MSDIELLQVETTLKIAFSFNKYQSELLAFLLSNGESTISQIIKNIKMPRSRVYDVADFLCKNKFIKIIKKSNLVKPNRHSKLHRDYREPGETRYIPFPLDAIIRGYKAKLQLEVNSRFNLIDEHEKYLEKQLSNFSSTGSIK